MKKEFLKDMGYGKQVKLVEQGKCPFCCKDIDPDVEFKDDLSLEEYGISGLCQKCQDEVFV